MSMQTLTWDVDAAAVAGNSDAYSLALATQARQKWKLKGMKKIMMHYDELHDTMMMMMSDDEW